MNLPRTKSATATAMLLVSLFVTVCILLSCTDRSALYVGMLPFVGVALMATLVIVVARAAMVAWITVLVLLAFSGKRRRVLAQHGREITADVAVHLVRVVFRERGLAAVVCAAIVSLMTMVPIKEAE
ncbi:uncharacterized protein LOC133876054 [Alnus glutinosa]|uniref:uncharacterized protein LOC133876054 n=1 Tax=Alnus glutinosa TaxID=3517 RepID=UPI002D789828|nr:uncharacterized protein LOC133876054 [Alnus glutinosa]